jgi:hypothetical protein
MQKPKVLHQPENGRNPRAFLMQKSDAQARA